MGRKIWLLAGVLWVAACVGAWAAAEDRKPTAPAALQVSPDWRKVPLIAALGEPPATSLEAWEKIETLVANDELSAEQRSAMIERALAEQAGPNPGPVGRRGSVTDLILDYLGQQVQAHALSPAQEARFYERACTLRLEVRPKVGRGDPVPFVIRRTARGPQEWRCNNLTAGAFVDGRAVKLDWPQLGTYAFLRWEDDRPFVHQDLPPQPPGPHRLVVKVTDDIGIGIVNSPYTTEGAAPFYSKVLNVPGQFEVTDVSPPIKHQNNGVDAAAIAKVIRVENVRFDGVTNDVEGVIMWAIDRHARPRPMTSPANIAFEAFARVRGKEYPCAHVTASAGTPIYQPHMNFAPPPDGRVETLDLVLRSSDNVARETVGLYEIWSGEVTIPNVPVKWER